MDPQIITVLIVLSLTVIAIILDLLRIDVIAIISMLSLTWLKIITPKEALSGFSSNAVLAMIAVMIMGKGVYDTGVMNKFSKIIIKIAGKSQRKLIGLISSAVGFMSAIMQNIGSAALFLPAVLQISKKEKIPPSKLIMPLGFSAIIGGTLTMVGTGSLIVLNDLLKQNNFGTFGFFDVTPVGITLLLGGIIYFFIFGKSVLPSTSNKKNEDNQQKLINSWHLPHTIKNFIIPKKSSLNGMSCENSNIWSDYNVNILAIREEENIEYAPWRHTKFEENQKIAVLGSKNNIKNFASDYKLESLETTEEFDKLRDESRSGFAEIIIPAKSKLVGGTIRKFSIRKTYGVEPVLFFCGGEIYRGDFSDKIIKPGDTIIFYGLWENLKEFKNNDDFVVATEIEDEEKKPSKAWFAILSFAGAILLTFLTNIPISICLLTGAIVMILSGVININKAYEAIDWKVVFLIAGLIPLGVAMEKSGTALFLANQLMYVIQGQHPLIILSVVGLLSTLFSLFMSNVAATVLLVPLVLKMSNLSGINPTSLALLVGVCAANSFILPTHQVNAFLMTPGGYKNSDYLKAGSGMTLIFLLITVIMFYSFYI